MNFDLVLEETRNKIIETLNKSGLPITALDLLIKDIGLMVHNQAVVTINNLRNREVKEDGTNKQDNQL